MLQMLNDYVRRLAAGWNQFWFKPADGAGLAVMRILVGSLLFYSHLVWTLELPTFFSESGVLPSAYRSQLPGGAYWAWSHFDVSNSAAWMYGTHCVALVVFLLFTVGLWTRVTSILAALFVISYANRATGALFGMDQICAFVTLYLAVGNSGQAFSLDRWWKNKKSAAGQGRAVEKLITNNIAIRLIQIHLCIVYLFAGLGKLQGVSWWNGEAIWGALASYEYQTLDLTWMADHMWLVNLITFVAVAWEVSYCCLVWPKLSRPFVLLLALFVHLGIGMAMGMMTFGLIMIFGNLAFVPPEWFRRSVPFPRGEG